MTRRDPSFLQLKHGALLVLTIVFAVSAAPVYENEQTAIESYESAEDGCYYNYNHYGEGDRIVTNEPCLNCTCHNKMLMCYLRVCPFTKPIGQDCVVEKREDQCCPIITCPPVQVELEDSSTTVSSTDLALPDNYGCSINNHYYSEGAQVPSNPNKPCELCYCIRNMTACVMQECTLHVDGCQPIYNKGVCCPVRYSCDHENDLPPMIEDHSDLTTIKPTEGFMLITPKTESSECLYENITYSDGVEIKTQDPCRHCYCMKGDIVCALPECGSPLEHEEKSCVAVPPKAGQCCPDTYICDGSETITIPPESDSQITDDDLQQHVIPAKSPVKGGTKVETKRPTTKRPIEEIPKDTKADKSSEEDDSSFATTQIPSAHDETTLSLFDESGEIDSVEKDTTTKTTTDIERTTQILPAQDERVSDDSSEDELTSTEKPSEKQDDEQTTVEADTTQKEKEEPIEEKTVTSLIDTTISDTDVHEKNEQDHSEEATTSIIEQMTQQPIIKDEIEIQTEVTRTSTEPFDSTETSEIDTTTKVFDSAEVIMGKGDGHKGSAESGESVEDKLPATTPVQSHEEVEEVTTHDEDLSEVFISHEVPTSLSPPLEDFTTKLTAEAVTEHDKTLSIDDETTTQDASHDDSLMTETHHNEDTTVLTPPAMKDDDSEDDKSGESVTASDVTTEGAVTEKSFDHEDESSGDDITEVPDTKTDLPPISDHEGSKTEKSITPEEMVTMKIEDLEPSVEETTRIKDSSEEGEGGHEVKGSPEIAESDEENIPFTTSQYDDVTTHESSGIEEEITDSAVPVTEQEQSTEKHPVVDSKDGESVAAEDETTLKQLEDVSTTTLAIEEKPFTEDRETPTATEDTKIKLEEEQATEKAVSDYEEIPPKEIITELPSLPSDEELLDHVTMKQDPIESDSHILTETTTESEEPVTTTLQPLKHSETESDDMNTIVPERATEQPDKTYIPPTTTQPDSDDTTEKHTEAPYDELPPRIPGETDCLFNGVSYQNSDPIPTEEECLESCFCHNSIVRCKSSCDYEATVTEKSDIDDETSTAKVVEVTKPSVETPAIVKEIFPTEIPTTGDENTEQNENDKETVTTGPGVKSPIEPDSVESTESPESDDITTEESTSETSADENLIDSYEDRHDTTTSISHQVNEHDTPVEEMTEISVSEILFDTTLQPKPLETDSHIATDNNENTEGPVSKPGSLDDRIGSDDDGFVTVKTDFSTEVEVQATDKPESFDFATTKKQFTEIETEVQATENPESFDPSTTEKQLAETEPSVTEYIVIEKIDHTTQIPEDDNTFDATEKTIKPQMEDLPTSSPAEETPHEETTKSYLSSEDRDEIVTSVTSKDNEDTATAAFEIDQPTTTHSVPHFDSDEKTQDTTDLEKSEETSTSGKTNLAESHEDNTVKNDINISFDSDEDVEKVTKVEQVTEKVDGHATDVSIDVTDMTTPKETEAEDVDESTESIKPTEKTEIEIQTEANVSLEEEVAAHEPLDTSTLKQHESSEPTTQMSVEKSEQPTGIMTEPSSVEEETTFTSDSDENKYDEEEVETTTAILVPKKPEDETSLTTTESIDNKVSSEEDVTTLADKSHEPEIVTSTSISTTEVVTSVPKDNVIEENTTKQVLVDEDETSVIETTPAKSDEPVKSDEDVTEPSEQDLLKEKAEATTPVALEKEEEKTVEKETETSKPDEEHTTQSIAHQSEVETTTHAALDNRVDMDQTTTAKSEAEKTPKPSDSEEDTQKPIDHDQDIQKPVDHDVQVPQHPHEEPFTTDHPIKQPTHESGAPPHTYPSYDDDYTEEDEDPTQFGPGTCRYGGKLYVSAQQIPRDDPCDFCFCFRSDIICLQQSCPPPIQGCHEEPIPGFCCPRYECHVKMATILNITTSTTTTTTTLPPHFVNSYKGAARKSGCQVQGKAYAVGEEVVASSGPCMRCICGGDANMKCEPKACSPSPMLQQMAIASQVRRR